MTSLSRTAAASASPIASVRCAPSRGSARRCLPRSVRGSASSVAGLPALRRDIGARVRFASGLTALVLLTSAVRAEQSPRDARGALADQLAAELDTLAKTVATVDSKVSDAEAARLRRIRAAYRILRTPLASSGDGVADSDRMANARRRAAA